MKISRKLGLVISISIGLLIGALLPVNTGDSYGFLKGLTGIVINAATFLVMPLLFLQTGLSAYALRPYLTKRYYLRALCIPIGLTALCSILGTLLVVIFPPDRIPVILQESVGNGKINFDAIAANFVPPSFFQIFSGSLVLVPALFLLAFALGMCMYDLRGSIRPVFELAENIHLLLERLNGILVGFLIFCVGVPALAKILSLREIKDISIFGHLLVFIVIPVCLVVFLFFPLFIRFFRKEISVRSYFRLLLEPGVFGFLSGSNLSTYSFLYEKANAKKILRPGRQAMLSFLTIFSRAGTAFVVATTFLVIIRSYSSLEIGPGNMILVFGITTILSLALSAIPGPGVFVALVLLSQIYGQGLEDGYLIVQPVIPILISFAVLMDVAAQAFLLVVVRDVDIGSDNRAGQRKSKLLDDFQF